MEDRGSTAEYAVPKPKESIGNGMEILAWEVAAYEHYRVWCYVKKLQIKPYPLCKDCPGCVSRAEREKRARCQGWQTWTKETGTNGGNWIMKPTWRHWSRRSVESRSMLHTRLALATGAVIGLKRMPENFEHS